MVKDWSRSEILKAVFPFLDGHDLASCMLVCRQWKEVAKEDYLWKCICARRWPSTCKRSFPPLSFHKLFLDFSKPQRAQTLLPPKLSLNDLEFYIDLWAEETLIFSEAVTGSKLQAGMATPPPEIPDILRAHLDAPEYKMVLQLEPRFTVPLGKTVSASVLVSRGDTNRMACLVRQSVFDYVDRTAYRALAYDYLRFGPSHPFVSGIRAWLSLLFITNGDNDSYIDVFGIEIDFYDAAGSEEEVLWLIDMLDWK